MRGISRCLCCQTLPRVSIQRLSHVSQRTFRSTAVLEQDPAPAKLPTTDWSKFKPSQGDIPQRRLGSSRPPFNGQNRNDSSNGNGSRYGARNGWQDRGPASGRDDRSSLPGMSKWSLGPDAGPSRPRQAANFGQGANQGQRFGQPGARGNERTGDAGRVNGPRQGWGSRQGRENGSEMSRGPRLGQERRNREDLSSGPAVVSNFGFARGGRSNDRNRFGDRRGGQLGQDEGRGPSRKFGQPKQDIGKGATAGKQDLADLQPVETEEADVELGDEVGEEAGSSTGKLRDREHSKPSKFQERMSRSFSVMGGEDFELERDNGRRKKNEVIRKHQEPSRAEIDAERKKRRDEKRAAQQMKAQAEKRVFIPSTMTVARLASILGLKWSRLQMRMAQLGMSEDQRRADFLLNSEEAVNIALEFGFDPQIDDEAFFDILPDQDPPGVIQPLRPPVVTIMGHVDHGKTTLLDSLRNTAVAAGEAGGITQHIGAFSVPLSSLTKSDEPDTGATITFLDTPGHAAFTEMRARGATVTDIVVLVVAADDGVMPQTREVLNLVKEAGEDVGLVVAINKIDKHSANIENVKRALQAEGIQLEEDGGDIPAVKVSGLSKLGLDDLVETLSTLAELRELRARSAGKAEGYVLESNVDAGKGAIATVLVTKGTLKTGSVIVANETWCRIRAMSDDKGNPIDSATPGQPVRITGWRELPEAGDQLLESINGEAEARKAITNRLKAKEQAQLLADTEIINVKRQEDRAKHQLESEEEKAIRSSGGNVFLHRLEQARKAAADARDSEIKELRLIIKGDVSGTVEAVEGALQGIGNKEAMVKIIHTGVGAVSESDVTYAEAAGALLVGFNVTCPKQLQQLANQLGVSIHLESVIYRLIETVRERTAALLPPVIETRVTGEATVLQKFEIKVKKKQSMIIAGCRAAQGTIKRNSDVRILRGPERTQIYEGIIETLKHVKKDVDEIRKGTECGIGFSDNFADIREGDEVITFTKHEVPRSL